MTQDDFMFRINVRQPLEFCFRGKTYNLTYGRDEEGDYIAFGRLYETPGRYYSVGELLNEVKIENSYLKEVLEDL